jgi:hypothetical protein
MIIGCARNDAWEPGSPCPLRSSKPAMMGRASAASQRWAEPTRGGHSERLKCAKTGWPIPPIRSVCPFAAIGFVQSDRR